MIKLFDSARKILFFPRRWANSVTLWIQNVRSPDDTIKIGNTINPKAGDSLSLRVNLQKLYDGVAEYLKGHYVTRRDVADVVDAELRAGGTATPKDIDEEITNPPTSNIAYNSVDGQQVSAAQTNTWERASATAGISVDVFTRQIVRAGCVYWLYRTFTFDKLGRLVSIGEEQFGHYTSEGF